MTRRWDDLELPVLKALAELEDHQSASISDKEVAAATGLDPSATALALRRLTRADYIRALEMRDGGGGPTRYVQIELAERGLRAAGAWPADEYPTSCDTS